MYMYQIIHLIIFIYFSDLAKEDKQFVQEVCNFSARLLCVLTVSEYPISFCQ